MVWTLPQKKITYKWNSAYDFSRFSDPLRPVHGDLVHRFNVKRCCFMRWHGLEKAWGT